MARMSAGTKLDLLMKQYGEHIDRIDESTKKIAERSDRIEANLNEACRLSEKTGIPLRKFKVVGEFAQCVLDACCSFSVVDEVKKGDDGTSIEDDASAGFMKFSSNVEQHLKRCEKEITKLNMLERVTKSITES